MISVFWLGFKRGGPYRGGGYGNRGGQRNNYQGNPNQENNNYVIIVKEFSGI